jgi:stage III sporulation protein SpoIIIAA
MEKLCQWILMAGCMQLVEVVLDLGRPPVGRFLEGARKLSDIAVSQADLSHATDRVNDFGVDNRAGINGTLHRVSCMRNRDGNIVGVTLRVGRAVSGSAQILADILFDGRSVLLLGEALLNKLSQRQILTILSQRQILTI